MPLAIEGLCKAYGERQVLDRFSHRFPEGQISCILGPSGCGKTTLLHLIAGLEDADAGRIEGADPKRISMVFQENRLLENLSAEKNVLLTAKSGFGRREARQLLMQLGIADPSQRATSLSGGMARRVAIARALALDYDLLLLDEPLSGLDGETRLQVLEIIKKMTAGRTVIWVTHQLEVAHLLGAHILNFTESAG